MKDIVYFPHDANATFDAKMLDLRGEYGYEGLGMFWAIVEQIRMNGDECRYKKDALKGMSLALNIEREKLKTIIEYCCQIGLFTCDAEYIWSKRMVEDYEWMKSKSTKSKAAAKSRWDKSSTDIQEVNADAMPTQCERNADAMPIKDSIVKESKEKDIKVKEKKVSAKAVSISAFLSDLPELERSLCERFIKHRKLITKPVASVVGVKGFLSELKDKSEDQALWPTILDLFEKKEWQSVKWVTLEDTTPKESIHIAYEYALCMAGADNQKDRRWFLKEITKYPAEFIGVLAWYWRNAEPGEMKRIIVQHLVDEYADKKGYRRNYAKKTPEQHMAYWTDKVEEMRNEQNLIK